MSYMNYVKPLTFWGAIIAIIVALISIGIQGFGLLLAGSWLWLLGPFAALSYIVYIVVDVIAIICAFIVWRTYYPMLDTNPQATAIPLIILGILSWAAFGGLLIFIAGILVFVEKEGEKA
jgi:hypothetical protein